MEVRSRWPRAARLSPFPPRTVDVSTGTRVWSSSKVITDFRRREKCSAQNTYPMQGLLYLLPHSALAMQKEVGKKGIISRHSSHFMYKDYQGYSDKNENMKNNTVIVLLSWAKSLFIFFPQNERHTFHFQ